MYKRRVYLRVLQQQTLVFGNYNEQCKESARKEQIKKLNKEIYRHDGISKNVKNTNLAIPSSFKICVLVKEKNILGSFEMMNAKTYEEKIMNDGEMKLWMDVDRKK